MAFVISTVVEFIEWKAVKDLHRTILNSASVVPKYIRFLQLLIACHHHRTAQIHTVKMFRDYVVHAVLVLDGLIEVDPVKHLPVVICRVLMIL